MKKLLIAALVASACYPAPVFADKAVKDASGTNFNLCTTTNSTTEIPCHQVKNSSGTTIDPATAGNQTATQNSPGTNGATADTIQGVDGGKPVTVGGQTKVVGCSNGFSASVCFQTTTSTTAFTPNQMIASSTSNTTINADFAHGLMSFSVCRVNAGTGHIERARVAVATDSGYAAQPVYLYLYKSQPTVQASSGDHATFLTDESINIGRMTGILSLHFSDYEKGTMLPEYGARISFDCASGSQTIYGLLATGGNITPGSATAKNVKVTLEIDND